MSVLGNSESKLGSESAGCRQGTGHKDMKLNCLLLTSDNNMYSRFYSCTNVRSLEIGFRLD